jgi:predicted transcriptional regulator
MSKLKLFVKRGRFEIIDSILSMCVDAKSKSQILQKCSLSWSQLDRYLDYLLPNELMEVITINGKTYFKITEKGLEFIQNYRKFKEFDFISNTRS